MNKVVTKDDAVTAVETSHGTIQCEYFVNCAGQVMDGNHNYMLLYYTEVNVMPMSDHHFI